MTTALGVYIFAGGFTVGVKRAGFDVLGHLEDGPFGVATTEANHPGLSRAAGTIHTDPEAWPLAAYAGRVDFVYGNPPCAPWSAAGMSPNVRRGASDAWYDRDPRTSCVYNMFGVLEAVRPRAWAWESVARAATVGRPMIDELAARAAALGYACSIVLLDCADTGLPQTRKRVFVVFHDVAIAWRRPDRRRVTVREALAGIGDPGDAPRVAQNITDLYGHVRPGEKFFLVHDRLNGRSADDYVGKGRIPGHPNFLQRRLDWDRPSFTMTGGPHLHHPDEPRPITVAEAAAVCGYPPGYAFVGPMASQYSQMAKAVTPPAGEWLAGMVAAGIRAAAPVEPATRVHDFLRGEAAVQAVPRQPRARAASPPTPAEPSGPEPELAMPAQTSALPLWEAYTGPTMIAKALIAEGHGDDAILRTCRHAINGAKAAGAKWPHLFTRTDLARLRARLAVRP